MASPAISFAKENEKRFLEELKELLRIPSISTILNTEATSIRPQSLWPMN